MLDAYTDNPGTWLFHCHLTHHIQGGMMMLFNVAGAKPAHNLNGKVCAGCVHWVCMCRAMKEGSGSGWWLLFGCWLVLCLLCAHPPHLQSFSLICLPHTFSHKSLTQITHTFTHTLSHTKQTREYFIAAEEVLWDYAPFGGEMCGGSLVNFSDNAKTFVEAGPGKIGRKFVKALYVEYTDATFTQKKVREEKRVNGWGGCLFLCLFVVFVGGVCYYYVWQCCWLQEDDLRLVRQEGLSPVGCPARHTHAHTQHTPHLLLVVALFLPPSPSLPPSPLLPSRPLHTLPTTTITPTAPCPCLGAPWPPRPRHPRCCWRHP